MNLNVYELIWFKLGMMIDTTELLIWYYFDSRSQECKKAKSSVPVISYNFNSIWMERGIVLRLDGVMNYIPLHLIHPKFKGEKPTDMTLFIKKNKQTKTKHTHTNKQRNRQKPFCLYSDVIRQISFKLVMIETTRLYILISVWPWPSFKVPFVW